MQPSNTGQLAVEECKTEPPSSVNKDSKEDVLGEDKDQVVLNTTGESIITFKSEDIKQSISTVDLSNSTLNLTPQSMSIVTTTANTYTRFVNPTIQSVHSTSQPIRLNGQVFNPCAQLINPQASQIRSQLLKAPMPIPAIHRMINNESIVTIPPQNLALPRMIIPNPGPIINVPNQRPPKTNAKGQFFMRNGQLVTTDKTSELAFRNPGQVYHGAVRHSVPLQSGPQTINIHGKPINISGQIVNGQGQAIIQRPPYNAAMQMIRSGQQIIQVQDVQSTGSTTSTKVSPGFSVVAPMMNPPIHSTTPTITPASPFIVKRLKDGSVVRFLNGVTPTVIPAMPKIVESKGAVDSKEIRPSPTVIQPQIIRPRIRQGLSHPQPFVPTTVPMIRGVPYAPFILPKTSTRPDLPLIMRASPKNTTLKPMVVSENEIGKSDNSVANLNIKKEASMSKAKADLKIKLDAVKIKSKFDADNSKQKSAPRYDYKKMNEGWYNHLILLNHLPLVHHVYIEITYIPIVTFYE